MKDFINESRLPRLRIDMDSKYKTIVHLDAGHGGMVNGVYQTAGKQWDYGDFHVYEGVVNRAIVTHLVEKMFQNHISYNLVTISNHDESLAARMMYVDRIAKSYPKQSHIFLSVHHDATASESSANGCSFYTTKGITDSDYAANLYFPFLYDLGMKVRVNRARKLEFDQESNFYVIRKAEESGCIALLFELGFMTNREEALKIITDEHQITAANALYEGTLAVLEKIEKDGTVR